MNDDISLQRGAELGTVTLRIFVLLVNEETTVLDVWNNVNIQRTYVRMHISLPLSLPFHLKLLGIIHFSG